MPRLIGHIRDETTSDFSTRVVNDYLTVDKTGFIRQFLLEASAISLITQPRRFGKSTTFSMLQYFCAATVNGVSTKGLFDRFEIATVDNGEFLKKHQGQYPVIAVSFKDVKDNTYEEALSSFRDLFEKLYRQHKTLLLSDKLDEDDKRVFRIYLEGTGDHIKLQSGLQFLSEVLYKAYDNKRVIILIDEYDAPLSSAYEHKFLDKLSGFMRNLFSAALKDSPFVHKGLMFGILRVSQSSMLSGLNNLRTYTVLDSTFQQYFGFTEAEVSLLVEHAKTHHDLPAMPFEEIKRYYNGYKVGDTILYNPWSIMQFITQQRLEAYWVTSANDYLLKRVLLGSRAEDKAAFGQLVQQKSVERKLRLNLRYEDLMLNPDALWTLLLFGGYLTVGSQRKEGMQTLYTVKIPNVEVLEQYTDIFTEWLKEIAGGEAKYQAFLEHLINGRIEEFTQELGQFMLAVLSVKDVSGDKEQPERFYHGMMIGVMSSLRDKYHILSNREGGIGFYDTMLIPKGPDKELAMILEYKRCKSHQDMATVAKEALAQINAMHYSANLADYPHVNRVMSVGLAFRDKSVQSAYEERDAVTGALIGSLNLSMEYGSDDEIFDAKDMPASSSSTIDIITSSMMTPSTIHKSYHAKRRIDESDKKDEDVETKSGKRSRVTAGFLDAMEDEEGVVAAPSASKLYTSKPQE